MKKGIFIFSILIILLIFINNCSKKESSTPTSPVINNPTLTPTWTQTFTSTPTYTFTYTPTYTPQPYGKIVYESNSAGGGFDFDIFVYKFSTGLSTNLTADNTGFDGYPSWLYNKTQIYFITDRSIGNGLDIYVMNEDGTNVFEKIGTSEDKYYPRKGNFNTNKHMFYHKYNSNTSKTEICAWDNTTSNEVVILSSGGANYAWCDYNYFINKIVYMSDSTGYKQIYIANPDGSNAVQLTTENYNHTHPKFNYYGTKIVYVADNYSNGLYNVWIMNIDGTNKQQLTYNFVDTYDTYPCFSPDDYWVLYAKYDSSNNADLYIIPADGNSWEEKKIIGYSNSIETRPDWCDY